MPVLELGYNVVTFPEHLHTQSHKQHSDLVDELLPWHWNPCFPKPLWTEDRGGKNLGNSGGGTDNGAYTDAGISNHAFTHSCSRGGSSSCVFGCIPSPELRFRLGVRAMRLEPPHPPDRPGAPVAMWRAVVMAHRCAALQTRR